MDPSSAHVVSEISADGKFAADRTATPARAREDESDEDRIFDSMRSTASPRSAAARTPSTFSRIHCSGAPEKWVARGAPRAPDELRFLLIERGDDSIRARVLSDDGVVPRPSGTGITDHAVSRWLLTPMAAGSAAVRPRRSVRPP